MLGAKRYREAHAVCASAIQQNPNAADAFYVLGIVNYDHQRFDQALKLFQAALGKGHPEAGPHIQAARCFAALKRPKEALAHIEAAKDRHPQDGFSLSCIGTILSGLDLHEQAAKFHRKAADANPKDALSYFNLGSSLQFLGDFDRAQEAYRACLRIAPHYNAARAHLALMSRHTTEHNDLATLEAAWQARHPQDIEGGLQLAHALAKVHEDLGDIAASMTWLDRGKGLMRGALPSRRGEDAAGFEAAESLCGNVEVSADVAGDGPIFIVGLPRTGTTLVDRILSSHSLIRSAGERSEFGAALHRAAGVSGPDMFASEVISKAAEINLSAVGADYLEGLRAILGDAGRFTDKMPVNAFFVPVILAALPSARVICLRRHPADSVLSIYRQLFGANALHYRYAHDLKDLVDYVVNFHELVDAYAQALPASRFTVVDYEVLTNHPDTEIRRLLEFCGLAFEQACMEFQDNAAPVGTASVAQVRQSMYTTSIGRWERYREYLEPAMTVLEAHGLLSEG